MFQKNRFNKIKNTVMTPVSFANQLVVSLDRTHITTFEQWDTLIKPRLAEILRNAQVEIFSPFNQRANAGMHLNMISAAIWARINPNKRMQAEENKCVVADPGNNMLCSQNSDMSANNPPESLKSATNDSDHHVFISPRTKAEDLEKRLVTRTRECEQLLFALSNAEHTCKEHTTRLQQVTSEKNILKRKFDNVYKLYTEIDAENDQLETLCTELERRAKRYKVTREKQKKEIGELNFENFKLKSSEHKLDIIKELLQQDDLDDVSQILTLSTVRDILDAPESAVMPVISEDSLASETDSDISSSDSEDDLLDDEDDDEFFGNDEIGSMFGIVIPRENNTNTITENPHHIVNTQFVESHLRDIIVKKMTCMVQCDNPVTHFCQACKNVICSECYAEVMKSRDTSCDYGYDRESGLHLYCTGKTQPKCPICSSNPFVVQTI